MRGAFRRGNNPGAGKDGGGEAPARIEPAEGDDALRPNGQGLQGRWRRWVLGWLELVRPELPLGAVSHVWTIVMLGFTVETQATRTEALGQLGWLGALAVAASAALGVGLSGLALHDVVEARRDRAMAPKRPIPSGRVGASSATVLGMAGAAWAVACATLLGATSSWLIAAAVAAVLGYALFGRMAPGVAVVALGAVYGLLMAAANPRLSYAWPIMLAVTHVMASAWVGWFIVGKRRRPRRWETAGVIAAWAFGVLGLLALMSARRELAGSQAPAPEATLWLWCGPASAVVLYLLAAAWQLRRAREQREQGDISARFMRLSALWLMVYDVGWIAGAGSVAWMLPAAMLGAALLMGPVRELLAAGAAGPVGYRLR